MKALTSRSRLFGLVGHQAVMRKGMQTEKRVLDVFMRCQERHPEWLYTAYPATPEQDKKGIDYVVETRDLGKIFLQVKSSEHFARRFKLKQSRGRYNRFIAVVAIPDRGMDDDRVFDAICQALERSRALIRVEHRKCA